MKYLCIAFLTFFFLACYCERIRYDNFCVFRVKVNDAAALEEFQKLEEFSDGITFLNDPTIHHPFHILVPPHKLAHITELFEKLSVENEQQHANFQQIIDDEQFQQSVPYNGFGWNRYHDLNGIYSWIDGLAQQYPNILSIQNYGKSYEGRPLRAVKISKGKGKPTIFIESLIHAREWVAGATCTYLINELLTSNDPEIQNLANNYEWVIVPIVNVDGYDYTHSRDRVWRKNRRPNGNCIGVDLNRNFDFHHAAAGASTSPCAETYAGPSPFSEPETSALSRFIQSTPNIKLYVSFHAYSQLLLFPYGHSTQHAPNHNDLSRIAQATISAVSRRFGTQYSAGNIAEAIYVASGSSIDWVYGKLGVKLTYTFEFRDTGRFGFVLPPDQIVPNSQEFMDGLKAMVRESRILGYF